MNVIPFFSYICTKLYKGMRRNFFGMLVILMSIATIGVSAQTFKLSGGLREMLSDVAVNF